MGTRMEVAQLESRMNAEDYRKLQNLFLDFSGASRSLSRIQFIDLAWSSVGHGSEEEYGFLFDSVVLSQQRSGLLLDSDTSKEKECIDWGGLCSFLLMELSNKLKNSKTVSAPCWKPPRTLTCPHRDPVQKVLYLQSSGQYLTVSKGGNVGLRDAEDMSLLHTHRLQNSTVAPKDLWVTDVVLMQNVDKIAVAFTSKEVCFYDFVCEKTFSCKCKLQGLNFTPWCLDYWVDPCNPDQAVLTIGDIGGRVSALYFTSAQIFLFERFSLRTDSDSADIILWDDLAKGKHRSCYTVTHQAHAPGWVRKVRYLGSLEAFVSCSIAPQSSIVIGWREKESTSLRITSYSTKDGVWDVDFHIGLGLLATAGVDHHVLLWNPYVTSEPVCALGGHTSPVIAVCFLQTKQQLLSYSKDKVLCLWDVSSQLCTHRLAGVFPNIQGDTHPFLFLNEERQHLVLSFNSLLLLLESKREEKKTSSHEHPVTCVLYNSRFRQVVSSDSASSVIFWLTDTGQKVKQFHRCHGDAEISTMALDVTQTRLFTAGADGEVKVWDFNGRCLHRMNAGLGRAVRLSQVLLLKRSILVMGWERKLTVFRLHSFWQSTVEPCEWKGGLQHRGAVLCAAFQPPQTLVTGSYHGEIIVWNSSTEKALRKLRPHDEGEDCKKQQEDSESCDAITRLFFIPGRTSVTAAGAADLVSCGGSGTVRLWSTQHARLVGQFTAHEGDLGSIVIAVSPCGEYLTTADREGTVKIWDVKYYCLTPGEGVNKELPKLLSSFHPHLDHVTHLEMCLHGDKLLLLSASSDCSLALSYLPGETVGFFGQSDPWCLERPGTQQPQQEAEQDQSDRGRQENTGLEITSGKQRD
uniref:WD repeat-containing protein 49 n=1 Tax=Maylandia zebra TaxID=106582 RepID=UPI000D3080AA|nr:WD repeat-containing protein 49 [Maylandia zebra]